ncbi:hypothetical protein CEXT_49371 [Caerostris extrusa]|uniref:Uncharacterized protein n=1 Tax=Caerostris extrusa TaxID=172846 RepID=A0AAV4XNU6_CAEEX|nr:hypothetical protein CEXT_49371 [Caerostris extrusa]
MSGSVHSEIQQINGVHPFKGILAMGKTIYSFKPPFSSTSSMEPGFETAGRKKETSSGASSRMKGLDNIEYFQPLVRNTQ